VEKKVAMRQKATKSTRMEMTATMMATMTAGGAMATISLTVVAAAAAVVAGCRQEEEGEER